MNARAVVRPAVLLHQEPCQHVERNGLGIISLIKLWCSSGLPYAVGTPEGLQFSDFAVPKVNAGGSITNLSPVHKKEVTEYS